MINKLSEKKIIIVCGHYGTGKTNISVNLSVKLKEQTGLIYALADLDIVNPYFRSADSVKILRNLGINCIIPQFANTNVDIPAIPAEIYSIFASEEGNKRAVIDVGGDDNGAVVLGMFSEKIRETDYEMIYVVNKYRNMISSVESAVNLAQSIEDKSKLKISSIINNSNIGNLTREKEIIDSLDYARKIGEFLNAPVIFTTSFQNYENVSTFKINNYTKQYF